MADTSEPDLLGFALRARAFLEPLWIGFLCDPWSSVRLPLSTGACRVSSEFIAAVMPGDGFPGWAVHGGPDAFTDDDGRTHDHYWLSDGVRILDVTADQFGLPPVVLGPVDQARYRVGPAMPLSAGARSETGCVDAWIAGWRKTGGTPRRSRMTVAGMAEYAGPSAGALALMLHGETGLPLYLAATPGAPPHPLVFDGQNAFDARGLTDAAWFGETFGCAVCDLVPVTPGELRTAMGEAAPDALDAAYGFAAEHPALGQAIRQARYERQEREAADEACEDGAGAFSP